MEKTTNVATMSPEAKGNEKPYDGMLEKITQRDENLGLVLERLWFDCLPRLSNYFHIKVVENSIVITPVKVTDA